MNAGLTTRVRGWLSQPFNEQGGILDWVLFTVLVVTVSFAWTRVLLHIVPAEKV